MIRPLIPSITRIAAFACGVTLVVFAAAPIPAEAQLYDRSSVTSSNRGTMIGPSLRQLDKPRLREDRPSTHRPPRPQQYREPLRHEAPRYYRNPQRHQGEKPRQNRR